MVRRLVIEDTANPSINPQIDISSTASAQVPAPAPVPAAAAPSAPAHAPGDPGRRWDGGVLNS